MNKRGIALILVFIIIVVLTILGASIISRGIAETRILQRTVESTQAFWLAESGLMESLFALKANFNAANIPLTLLGQGVYNAIIGPAVAGTRTVTANGCMPAGCNCNPLACRTIRTIQATMAAAAGPPPANFYNNVIYAAGGLDVSGGSNAERGNITYALSLNGVANIVLGTGVLTRDDSINPLAPLDYNQLRQISRNQNNYHDATHNPAWPGSFWFDQPNRIPNIVFTEGDFTIHGNTQVSGFYVVGGEVACDATLSGNVAVDGCIYTRGDFTVNGGGHAINIFGGVWVGGIATLHGGVDLRYNPDYMNAIQNLNINTVVQMTNWRDTQNPYTLQ